MLAEICRKEVLKSYKSLSSYPWLQMTISFIESYVHLKTKFTDNTWMYLFLLQYLVSAKNKSPTDEGLTSPLSMIIIAVITRVIEVFYIFYRIFILSKGSFLRRTVSFDVLSVKIHAGVSAVGDWKNQKK